MSDKLINFADFSSDTLRDMVVEIREIIHARIKEMHSPEDLAKRLDMQEHIRRNTLIQKYDELTDMIKNVGKSNAGEYIHERRRVANILLEDFGIVTDETRHLVNPVVSQETSSNLSNEDMVNHPPHYTTGNIEVIDFIDDKNLGFYEGQVIKYVSRAKLKGNEIEDLKKAQWYLNRLIERLDGEKSMG